MANTQDKTDLPILFTSLSKEDSVPNITRKENKEHTINMLEKKLSDKFEEYSNKKTSQKIIQSGFDRPTQILEVNQVSRFLSIIEGRMNKTEQSLKKRAGFAFGLIAAFVFAAIGSGISLTAPQLPAIQILFVVMLISFLLNYFLVRDGEILPYIETENENFQAKICGAAGFGSLILFVYSFQQCEINTSLFCVALSWVVFLAFEACSKKISHRLNRRQALFGILMVVLSYFVLDPNFTPEINEIDTPAEDQAVDPTLATDNVHMYGVISALASGILLGYMNYNIRQLKNHNFITITHIFTYIQAPFIPIFFPLQKLVSPSLPEWGFMIVGGIFFLLALQLLIRSSQLENPTSSLLAVCQFIAFIAIISFAANITSFGTFGIWSVISAVIILGLSYQFTTEISKDSPHSSNIESSTKNRQDIPLQTFSKNDNLSLSQKLLDNQN